MPAIDILKLDENEGSDYTSDLHLLFAASGDLRNVVKTVTSIPESYPASTYIAINDRDHRVVMRSAVLLLVAMMSKSEKQAADCMIHVWYSAFLPKEHAKLLYGPIAKMVAKALIKTPSEPGTVIEETWTFRGVSLRLVMLREQWSSLLACLSKQTSLDFDEAHLLLTDVTQSSERQDHRDHHYLLTPPEYRICEAKFRDDGMLLPFGQSRKPCKFPNPTFFHGDEWPLQDIANPMAGWSRHEVLRTAYGPAKNDLYGKLYSHLNTMFTDFHRRLQSLKIDFCLLNVDARNMDDHIKDKVFTRIEVSNISDSMYAGTFGTISKIARYLQPRYLNPHATLITLYMRAVDQVMTEEEQEQEYEKEFRKVGEYIPLDGIPTISTSDPIDIVEISASPFVRDGDKYFDRYMRKYEFEDVAQSFGVVVKRDHTVVKKWPTRPEKGPEEVGGKEEFMLKLASAQTGMERYVEWKRIA